MGFFWPPAFPNYKWSGNGGSTSKSRYNVSSLPSDVNIFGVNVSVAPSAMTSTKPNSSLSLAHLMVRPASDFSTSSSSISFSQLYFHQRNVDIVPGTPQLKVALGGDCHLLTRPLLRRRALRHLLDAALTVHIGCTLVRRFGVNVIDDLTHIILLWHGAPRLKGDAR